MYLVLYLENGKWRDNDGNIWTRTGETFVRTTVNGSAWQTRTTVVATAVTRSTQPEFVVTPPAESDAE